MVHGTVKGLLGLISTLVLILLIVMAAAAYRLSQGPVSLSSFTPTIEQALGKIGGSDLAVTLEDTSLVWDGEAQTLTIHLHNVRAVGANGRAFASWPDATVSLAGGPLLIGRVAVRGVRVIRPRLRLLRTAQGNFVLGLGEDVDADAAAFLDAAIGGTLAGVNAKDRGGSGFTTDSLDRVEIVGGDLVFDDNALDMHWHAPQVDLLLRRTDAGVTGSLSGPINIGGQSATLSAEGIYKPDAGNVTGTIAWTGVRPAYFARMMPALTPLSRLQLVTSGTSQFGYDTTKGLTDLAFDLTGATGALDLAPMLATPLKVNAVTVKGKMANGFDAVTLDDLRVDLGGPKLVASGKATGLNSTPHVDGAVRLDDIPVDTAKTIWPASVAANARGWIAANLSGGTIRHADLKVVLSAPPKGSAKGGADLAVESMSGSLKGDGIAVHYFGSLPSARNVAAEATFDKDAMTIAVKSGVAGGVEVKSGTVKIGGFLDAEQSATISLDVATSVRDALRLIDTKPLGYASAIGFDPERAKGDATATLDVSLPLAKTVRMAQVKLRVRAHTTGLAVPKAAFGLDLTDGALNLDIDPKGMEVDGKAVLAAIPIDLTWRENFAPAPFRSRYHVKATLDDAGRKAIGLTDPAFQAPVMTGPVPIDATATMLDGGRGDIKIKADIKPIAVRLPGLNWSKAPGVSGAADVELRVNAGGIAAVPNFAISAGDGMEMRGDILFDAANHPRRVSVTTAKWGRSDFKGSITFKPDGELSIEVSGASFDASELAGGNSSSGGESHIDEKQRLFVTGKLSRVWLSDDGSLQNVQAVLTRGPNHWNNINVDANVGTGHHLRVEVKPATERTRRTLKVTSDDAGSVFGAFGILKNMRGGTLNIDGTYQDSIVGEPLNGTIKMADYRLVKAPLLARVLTVASLTGAGDVLSGDGIHFSKAEAQFGLVNGVVTLKDARTSGTELGITAKGQIDLDNDRLALEGTIVPAYAINGAVEDIPVIGTLLQGEKGGGLIAFTYSVKGASANPDVSVNPLSALTPGFLRGLFGLFDGGGDPKVPGGPAPGKSGGQAPLPQDKTND